MNLKSLIAPLLAVFGFAGMQGTAFAEQCPDRTHYNEQTNEKFFEEGIALAEEALQYAKQGQGAETKAATKSAMLKFKCIVSSTGEAHMQRPKARITAAGIKAGKGDTKAAIPLLEEGIALLNAIKPIS
ncbi:MAG: hypothetical protein ACU843_07505 [Gammaproteobacteria bacterium]